MPTLQRDDLGLHFEVSGEGLPVLLTHGFSATSAMFAGTARALVPDYRVVTWDLRGHGSSDSPDDPSLYSPELVMSDMVALLDHLDIGRAVVGGHSVGGFLTLQFAIAHPETVCALVLEDTGPGYRSEKARERWNTSVAEAYATALSERGLAGSPRWSGAARRSTPGRNRPHPRRERDAGSARCPCARRPAVDRRSNSCDRRRERRGFRAWFEVHGGQDSGCPPC